ncbi:hypothetical protein BCR34DRAFT_582671 [Clohesyomyces aquaticus]|uniref:Uncharacterized protein n=1 Tax=Clohesyomyces aquaticus TaxID=1231657 RepID=A0A1Y2A891_9PLEO|nr:hypothetical protein BCR34DRAFT_582671 [Clohesyomyces aquaticus]
MLMRIKWGNSTEHVYKFNCDSRDIALHINPYHYAAAMETQSGAGLAHTLQTVTFATLAFAIIALLPKLNYRSSLAKLFVFGGSLRGGKQRQLFLRFAKKIYRDGYKKFSGYRFASSDEGDTVVVPTSFLRELRKLPDHVPSLLQALDKVRDTQTLGVVLCVNPSRSMESKYTGLDTNLTSRNHSVRSDLTPALGRLNATICDEVDVAIGPYLLPCKDRPESRQNAKKDDPRMAETRRHDGVDDGP